MSATTQLITAEELYMRPTDELRSELIKGELIKMSPAGHKHGRIVVNLTAPLAQYVKAHRLGAVYGAETGFKLATNPDTVRAPDIAFVRQQQIERIGEPEGFWPEAPDLAVEVNSPGDTVSDVENKVQEYLQAGTRLVWVVSPRLRIVTVYRSLTDIITLTEKDMLDGGDVISGFQFSVSEIFE